MSYELFFYEKNTDSDQKLKFSDKLKGLIGKKKEMPVDVRILAFFVSLGIKPSMEGIHDGFDVEYLNEKTGSQFFFNLHTDTIPDITTRYTFPGFTYTGLWFTLNFARPHYVAHEAALLIDTLCRHGNLLIHDPQNTDTVVPFDPDSFIRTYDRTNSALSVYMYAETEGGIVVTSDGEVPLVTLSRNASFAFWKYMFSWKGNVSWMNKKDPTMDVPEITVLIRNSDKSVHQGIIIAGEAGCLIPPSVDLFLVDPATSPGFVRREQVREFLDDLLRPIPVREDEYPSLSHKEVTRFLGLTREVPREPLDGFQWITAGTWIEAE
jgi:hypothetical protein